MEVIIKCLMKLGFCIEDHYNAYTFGLKFKYVIKIIAKLFIVMENLQFCTCISCGFREDISSVLQ